ncbi:MAG: FliH/SctL family protein [Pirellulaceae bacterium]
MVTHQIPLTAHVTAIVASLPLTSTAIPVVTERIAPPPVVEAPKPDTHQQNEQVQQLLEHLAMQVEEIAAARRQSLAELQELAVRLAVRIARSIIATEVPDDVARIEKLAEQAIVYFDGADELTLRVHPELLAQLQHNHQPSLQGLQIEGDPTLSPGDCRIDGVDSTLMVDIEHKLSQIEQKLMEGLADAQTERRTTGERDRSLQRFPDRRNFA